MNFDYLLSLIFLCLKINLSTGWGWDFNLDIPKNPKCWFTECCGKNYIPVDIAKLRLTLNEKVYGQHLVHIVADAIQAHWKSNVPPRKALVLSFHGWPGSGKNYVSDFIADSLFTNGVKSQFVHHFIGRIHFPLESKTTTYQRQLYEWLKGNITNCKYQLFIFDEVDKTPSGVLNAIKPVIDYRTNVDGIDYSKSIFILLSNTGSKLINGQYQQYWESGRSRESLTIKDFENLIRKGVFNEEGGFYLSDTIQSNLIDHYIPFLPMERSHIIKCIKDQFKERNINNPREDHIQEVLEIIEWGPEDSKRFSKTGCKRISSKVAVLSTKYPRSTVNTEL